MITKSDLPELVLDAIKGIGGSGTVVEVSREMWRRHEAELRASGDLFYTWQYDIRWAAQKLRNSGRLAPAGRGASSRWSVI